MMRPPGVIWQVVNQCRGNISGQLSIHAGFKKLNGHFLPTADHLVPAPMTQPLCRSNRVRGRRDEPGERGGGTSSVFADGVNQVVWVSCMSGKGVGTSLGFDLLATEIHSTHLLVGAQQA